MDGGDDRDIRGPLACGHMALANNSWKDCVAHQS